MPPKEPMLKIEVSASCYNEIAAALEKSGHKLGDNVGTLTLERNMKLEQPIDFRLATIRKDAGIIASRAFNPSDMGITFVDFMDQIYEYIIAGKKASLPTAENLSNAIKEWK